MHSFSQAPRACRLSGVFCLLAGIILLLSSCGKRPATPDWPDKGVQDAAEKPLHTPIVSTAELPVVKGELPIRFVAYNLRNYLTMERTINGKKSSSTKPEREKAAIISILSKAKPDVLGICEIGTQADLDDLQQSLKSAGVDLPHTYLYGGSDPYRRQAILSRYPIIAHQKPDITYRLEGHVLQVNRGILDVTINLPGGPVRFLGVHLKSKREIPKFDQELMRRSEAHVLSKHAAGLLADSSLPLLIYGDFNDTRQSSTIRSVAAQPRGQQALHAIDLKAPDGSLWTQYWSYQDVYSRFDYIFVSDVLKPRIDMENSRIISSEETSIASDHRPLYVEIR